MRALPPGNLKRNLLWLTPLIATPSVGEDAQPAAGENLGDLVELAIDRAARLHHSDSSERASIHSATSDS